MRYLILPIVLFVLVVYVPRAHAACPTGCYESAGSCYTNGIGTACASQVTPPSTGTTLVNPLKGVDCSKSNGNCLEAFLLSILEFVIKIGTIVVILMLVYIGYLFVVAQGKEEKIREARQALLWTIVGALILIGAKAIQVGITETVKALSVP